MTKKKVAIIGVIVLIAGMGFYSFFNTRLINNLQHGRLTDSFSLHDIIDERKTIPFACQFGTFVVQMVESKNQEYKFYKLQGKGVLINSGYLHFEVGTHPQIIYATKKDSAIQEGSVLTAHCIAFKQVPYEGEERKDIDQSAALTEFYLINEP